MLDTSLSPSAQYGCYALLLLWIKKTKFLKQPEEFIWDVRGCNLGEWGRGVEIDRYSNLGEGRRIQANPTWLQEFINCLEGIMIVAGRVKMTNTRLAV